MRESDLHFILENLGDVDADNVGAVHAFSRELPDDYILGEDDLEYLSSRGLDGLEKLGDAVGELSRLKEEQFNNFAFLENNYRDFRRQVEGSVLERDSRLMYDSDTLLSKPDSCKIASFLVDMGLAEKVNTGLYRLTAETEDYRMVEGVLENF